MFWQSELLPEAGTNEDIFFSRLDLAFSYLFTIELLVNLLANWYDSRLDLAFSYLFTFEILVNLLANWYDKLDLAFSYLFTIELLVNLPWLIGMIKRRGRVPGRLGSVVWERERGTEREKGEGERGKGGRKKGERDGWMDGGRMMMMTFITRRGEGQGRESK